MYSKEYVFKYFVIFMQKGGRASGVNLEEVMNAWNCWQLAFNTGHNSAMVLAKKQILASFKKYKMTNTVYSASEREKINEFLTQKPEEVSNLILTKSYTQLEFNMEGRGII